MKSSNFFLAFPLSIISSANLTPSFIESAFPPKYKAAPAFKTTAFLLAPFTPFKIERVISAFSLGLPPTNSSLLHLSNPKSSGRIL